MLRFNFEQCEDQAHAAWQAGECSNHVNDACESLHVHAAPLDGAVLVENLDYTKATAVRDVWERYKDVDFVFVAGDDRNDERLMLPTPGRA